MEFQLRTWSRTLWMAALLSALPPLSAQETPAAPTPAASPAEQQKKPETETEPEPEMPSGETEETTGWVRTRANVELPPYVKAEAGKLTLFADFEHPEADNIPLYLVNRTGDKILIDGQDGDLYLKMEYQLPDGTWVRAESHTYPWCGNSYRNLTLPPGMHVLQPGKKVLKGEQGLIRYRGYGNVGVISNSAPGLVDPADLAAARVDQMSLLALPQEFYEWVVGELSFRHDDLSRSLACLQFAAATGEVSAVRAGAEKWVADLTALPHPSADQKLTLRKARKILSEPWSGRPSLARLLERCLAVVRNPEPEKAEFGSPEKETGLAWEFISDCASAQGKSPDSALSPGPELPERDVWKTVFPLAASRALNSLPGEVAGITKLLGLSGLADEFLPDEAFEKLLSSHDEELVRTAAEAFVRREKWNRLAGLARDLSKDNQLEVFVILATSETRDGDFGRPSVRTRPRSKVEAGLWFQVLRAQPVQATARLNSARDENPYDREYFKALFEYWAAEVQKNGQATADFDMGREMADAGARSVRFLNDWKNGDDLPLLKSLLTYRGYYERTGMVYKEGLTTGKKVVTRIFAVRGAAAEALKSRGESLPADLILEQEQVPRKEKRKPAK